MFSPLDGATMLTQPVSTAFSVKNLLNLSEQNQCGGAGGAMDYHPGMQFSVAPSYPCLDSPVSSHSLQHGTGHISMIDGSLRGNSPSSCEYGGSQHSVVGSPPPTSHTTAPAAPPQVSSQAAHHPTSHPASSYASLTDMSHAVDTRIARAVGAVQPPSHTAVTTSAPTCSEDLPIEKSK